MKKLPILAALLLLVSCSPRDFLSRRLAFDLIALSDAFKTQQPFVLQTGIVSNKDYFAPEYLVLQQHGWISATNTACPAGVAPAPCWDIVLTPSGVESVRLLITPEEAAKPSFAIPAAKRELVAITGVSQQGSVAEVDFTWRWEPLNELGAVLYTSDVHYRSTVGFRKYDDGWRVVRSTLVSEISLESALKNAEPAP